MATVFSMKLWACHTNLYDLFRILQFLGKMLTYFVATYPRILKFSPSKVVIFFYLRVSLLDYSTYARKGVCPVEKKAGVTGAEVAIPGCINFNTTLTTLTELTSTDIKP